MKETIIKKYTFLYSLSFSVSHTEKERNRIYKNLKATNDKVVY